MKVPRHGGSVLHPAQHQGAVEILDTPVGGLCLGVTQQKQALQSGIASSRTPANPA
jgi:hypothetical protein